MQQLLVAYLLNAAWQISIVAACAFLVSRLAGLSPQGRSRMWLMFLAAAAILPAVPLADLLPHATPTVARLPPSTPVMSALPASTHALAAPTPAIWLPAWLAPAMIALVAAVALLLAARLLIAGRAARRLVEQSRPAVLPSEVARALGELAHAHGRKTPPVRRSAEVSSPAVVGALRPVILVPEGLTADGDDLRAAMLHEMAHVLRHDYAVNLACEILTLPVAWHPGVVGLKAGVRHSRELACDAIAATAMASQKTYAKCLVSLAQSLGRQPQPHANAPVQAALAVGLFGRSNLEDRLMQLMTPRETEGPFVRTARICGLAAVGAGLLGSAALLHVTPVFAQPAEPGAARAASEVTEQAQRDAAKPDAAGHGASVTTTRSIFVTGHHAHHRHSWTTADGRSMTVVDDNPAEPSAEQKRTWERKSREAEEKAAQAEVKAAEAEAAAAKVEARVNSPEFKARIAAAEARGAEAERRVNSPEFKARIARAEARAAEAEARVNSPEFKARIAAAEARAAEAERMVNSPEFKARIANAQARAEAAAREGARAAEDGARAAEAGARAQAHAQEIMARTQARMAALSERIARQWDDEADDLPKP